MAKQQMMEKIYHRLGNSNDSDIPTATIAAFKLLFVPIGTLSDKKASPEQKRYAVTRDIATEVIALSAYLGVTSQVKKYAVAPLCKAYYKAKGVLDANYDFSNKDLREYVLTTEKNMGSREGIKKEVLDKFDNLAAKVAKFNETHLPDVKGFKNKAALMPKELYLGTKSTLSHVVICSLAVLVIPSLCNAVLKPIMKKVGKKSADKSEVKAEVNPLPLQNNAMQAKPALPGAFSFVNSKTSPNNLNPSFAGNLRVFRGSSMMKVGG